MTELLTPWPPWAPTRKSEVAHYDCSASMAKVKRRALTSVVVRTEPSIVAPPIVATVAESASS